MPVLLATALLAYSFGLRHAVDADHIAAIDNVTRKLMAEGRRPLSVGLFFSLGHSTIVVALSAAIVLGAVSFKSQFAGLEAFGNIAGTIISAGFLFALALVNAGVLLAILRGAPVTATGPASRLFRGLFRLIRAPWQMYPVGVLFGLGFDTATEVGLLGISAAEAASGLHLWTIMIFPALFTAGMSLIDTADGVMMVNAYGWAFTNPLRKRNYNLAVTALSVLVALLVGGVEVLGLVPMSGDGLVAILNNHFGWIGFTIIGLFLAFWAISRVVAKARKEEVLF
jgi:high-affinity nickel-transport protein